MPTSKACSLVYHVGGLGDFITALPAVRAWNRHNHGKWKILLGKPAFGILGSIEYPFDEVWDAQLPAFSRLYIPDTSLPDGLAARLVHVNDALLFAAQDSPLATRLRRQGIARLLAHDPLPRGKIHVCAYHCALVNHEAAQDACCVPRLTPCPAYAEEAALLLCDRAPFAAIHPGSGSARKNWSRRSYVELADRLRDQGLNIVWIAGPAEHEMRDFAGRDVVLRDVQLPVLVHILHAASLYAGNDSGISHLAAASGAPCVVLFGPSDPAVWRPMGKNVTVISANRKPCFPCHPSAAARPACADACINRISAGLVFDACMKIARKD